MEAATTLAEVPTCSQRLADMHSSVHDPKHLPVMERSAHSRWVRWLSYCLTVHWSVCPALFAVQLQAAMLYKTTGTTITVYVGASGAMAIVGFPFFELNVLEVGPEFQLMTCV